MENLPQETETIAVKRVSRLSEKIALAHQRFIRKRVWWGDTSIEIIGLIFCFLINFYLVSNFFGEQSANTTFSGPVLPLISKAFSFTGIPFTYAVQIVNAVFFIFFPLSYYLFIKAITGRKLAAFIAVLFASLPIYPFAKVRADFTFQGADSAHIASLAVIPATLFASILFIRRGGIKALIFAAATATLISLISPFGIITYGIMGTITTFSEVLLGNGRLKIFRFLTILVFSFALSSFWYNPGYFVWMITGPMGQEIRDLIGNLIPMSFFTAPVLLTFGYLLFDRKPNLQSMFMALFYTAVFALMVIAGGGLIPEHAPRYAAELGMSIAFLLGVVILKIYDFLMFVDIKKNRVKIAGKYLSFGLIGFVFLLLIMRIITGKEMIVQEEINVLGVWTGIDRTEIWVAKDQFGGIYAIVGYIISIAAAGTLTLLQLKVRKQVKATNE